MKFEGLLNRISPKLKGITYRLKGHFGFLDELDLYQQALVHLWQEFKSGMLEDKTDSYILQGCYFHLKNHIRVVRNKAMLLSFESVLREGDSAWEEKLSLEDYNSRNYFQELNDKMLADTIRNNGLTSREKHVLSLCSEGLTTREIGRNISVSHVRVVKIMAEIRRKCQRYLDKN